MTGDPAPRTGPPFAVLAVCTGNVCRSPALEVRLREALGPSADVRVSGAGLRALVGEPVDPTMARLLGELPDGLRARQLSPDMVRRAGLVLTMTTDQRRAVVNLVPAAVRRTFTLREFAELAGAAAGDGAVDGTCSVASALEELVRAAPRFRGRRSEGDDIEDPYGREPAVFARVLQSIDEAVEGLVSLLPVGDRV